MAKVKPETIELMQKIGGAFAVKLAELWLVCDPENRQTLELGYSHIFEHYEVML